MATNNFKPFATAAGANVTSQADYESLPALTTGFQSGKASSAQVNKALRQANFVSSSLAQFISNTLSSDVLDNGDQAAFITLISNALKRSTLGVNRQQIFTTSGSFTVPAGVTTLYVSGCAGGGGGGGGGGASSANVAGGGGGGGSGQFVYKQLITVTPGQVMSIAIGSGGTLGAKGGNGISGSSGGAGGNTSLGSLLVLTGGSGGGGGISSPSGGAGGGKGGAGYPTGSDGSDTSVSNSSGGGGGGNGGTGASNPFGGGGGFAKAGKAAGDNAYPAYGYGAGGGGGAGVYILTPVQGGNGGAGAPGILIIEW